MRRWWRGLRFQFCFVALGHQRCMICSRRLWPFQAKLDGHTCQTRTPGYWLPWPLAYKIAILMALFLWATPAFAQEFTVEMPLADAARVLPQAERVPDLVSERDALKEETAALKSQIVRYETLAALDEKIIDKERTLRGLAEEERDAYKDRAERIAKNAKGAGFWSKVKERAAEGALIGTIGGSALPGVGNLAGAVGGALVGAIVGAAEHLVESP